MSDSEKFAKLLDAWLSNAKGVLTLLARYSLGEIDRDELFRSMVARARNLYAVVEDVDG